MKINAGLKRALEHIAVDNINNSHDVLPLKEQTDKEYEIELLIREKYSLSQEVMLHRKKLMNDLTDEEWKEYTDYVEECIKKIGEI